MNQRFATEAGSSASAMLMLGGVLQLGMQVPALARIAALPRIGLGWSPLRAAWRHPGVGQILGKMGPAVIGVSVAQLSLMINSQIASWLGAGAVSTLVYADRLMELPTALLGVALGVVLTPGRSLAIDATLLPLGAPLWLDTTYPAGTPEAGRPLRRLMVAQDTGDAIKGAVRGDIYWGSGEAALRYAGPMRQRGRYYLLLPKSVADRMARS